MINAQRSCFTRAYLLWRILLRELETTWFTLGSGTCLADSLFDGDPSCSCRSPVIVPKVFIIARQPPLSTRQQVLKKQNQQIGSLLSANTQLSATPHEPGTASSSGRSAEITRYKGRSGGRRLIPSFGQKLITIWTILCRAYKLLAELASAFSNHKWITDVPR